MKIIENVFITSDDLSNDAFYDLHLNFFPDEAEVTSCIIQAPNNNNIFLVRAIGLTRDRFLCAVSNTHEPQKIKFTPVLSNLFFRLQLQILDPAGDLATIPNNTQFALVLTFYKNEK